jgi:hypothetical protein
MKKRKMKSKGKKLYKNTHGKTFRVVRNYKIRYLDKQREMLSARASFYPISLANRFCFIYLLYFEL